jgi:hypothetical protein
VTVLDLVGPGRVIVVGMALVAAAVVLAIVAEERRPPREVGTLLQLWLLFAGLLLTLGGCYYLPSQFE